MSRALRTAEFGVAVEVWGAQAIYTRPELKVERFSYAAMTPTAAVGLFKSIYWHPGMLYQITKIEILEPIRWWSIRRNETTAVSTLTRALAGETIDTAATRTQRMSVGLRDVRYRVYATIDAEEGARHTPASYRNQLDRRINRGAFFSPPYLGQREYPADFSRPTGILPVHIDEDMGLMPLRAIYEKGSVVEWEWFHAVVKGGVLNVPEQGLRVSSSAASGLEAAG